MNDTNDTTIKTTCTIDTTKTNDDALTTFIAQARAAFGPLTTEMVGSIYAQLERLAKTPSTERWLRALHEEAPSSKELYRDPTQGFLLLAHSEPTGLYRPPHDHGRSWVIYALSHGEMEMRTFARVQDEGGRVRLVQRDTTRLVAGEARVYLPGDIHDTRCVSGPSVLFRFTERDLKREDLEAHRITRYAAARDGVFTVLSA